MEGPTETAKRDRTTGGPRARTRRKGRLSREERASELCCRLSELATVDERRLQAFLEKGITGNPEKPGITALATHRIDVGDHAPIKQRYYMVSPKIQEAIHTEVEKMLEADIIEPSQSQ